MLTRLGGSTHITMPNFLDTGLSKAEILRFFDFQNGGRRHLEFLKSRNFIGYWGGEGRDASACQMSLRSVNQLRRYKIFRFFKMAAAAILDCRIHKILLADGVWGPRCIIVSNFVKIGRSVVEILQFFKFSRLLSPPSWIFEIAKFYWLLWSRGLRRISVPNFVIKRENVVSSLTCT